jgi:hypothetical protein
VLENRPASSISSAGWQARQPDFRKERKLNLIYNSEQYSVVEFGADSGRESLQFGGYEIMDKACKKEIFIGGTLAEAFRKNVEDLIATQPTEEDIDAFLGNYDVLMSQPVVLH